MTLADNGGTSPDTTATILLVEDDEPLLEFFSTILRREGYSVLSAVNGVETLDIAKARPNDPIHILFSDVAMPYMGGIQLVESLRETRPDIRVLLASGLPKKRSLTGAVLILGPSFWPSPFPSQTLPPRSGCLWRAFNGTAVSYSGKS